MNGRVLTVEKVVYWFFRLNSCLTIENFVIHPDYRGEHVQTLIFLQLDFLIVKN